MPRYDFVNPYARRSVWNDVGETFNDVLDSEARRRQEIEAKRRFDEQTAIQSGYLGVAKNRDYREGVSEGFDPTTNAWNPEASARAYDQRRGAELQKGTMKFGDDLDVARMRMSRGWEKDDQSEAQSYLTAMGGFTPEQAGAAVRAWPQTQWALGPSSAEMTWEERLRRIDQENAMKRIGASRGGQGGGGQSTEDFWKWMTHNRARYDDYGNRIGQLERLPVPQRTIDQEVGTPAGDAFTTDSTRTMGGRQREIGRLQAAQDAVGYDMDRGTEGMFPGVSSPRSRTGLTDDEMERALTDRKFYDWLTTKNKVRLEDYAADIEDYRRRRRGR